LNFYEEVEFLLELLNDDFTKEDVKQQALDRLEILLSEYAKQYVANKGAKSVSPSNIIYWGKDLNESDKRVTGRQRLDTDE
jgi:hypothetical protein